MKCMHNRVLRAKVSLCIRILNVNRKNSPGDVLQNPGIIAVLVIQKDFLWENYWTEQQPGASLGPGHILDEFHAISTLPG